MNLHPYDWHSDTYANLAAGSATGCAVSGAVLDGLTAFFVVLVLVVATVLFAFIADRLIDEEV